MSTKNLARSVIEGGRCRHYKIEVHEKQRAERTALRAYLRDPDESRVDPRRRGVGVCFDDKLAPIERFLRAQSGRPWNKVRAELFTRFDTRTTPGRHVLFDHVLRDVESPWPGLPPRYEVDAHGILHAEQRKRPRRYRAPTPFDRRAVERWLADRRIGRNGERLVWYSAMEKGANVHAHFPSYSQLVYAMHDDKGNPLRDYNPVYRTWQWRTARVTWLPHGLLSRAEEAFLRALPETAQAAITG